MKPAGILVPAGPVFILFVPAVPVPASILRLVDRPDKLARFLSDRQEYREGPAVADLAVGGVDREIKLSLGAPEKHSVASVVTSRKF